MKKFIATIFFANFFFVEILFIAFFSIGCSTTYQIADIQNHILTTQQTLDDSLRSIETDLKNKADLIGALQENSISAQLKILYHQLTKIKDQLVNYQKQLQWHLSEVQKLAKEKTKISKREEEFNKIKTYRDFSFHLEAKMKQLFKDYKKTAKHFAKVVDSHKIYFIDTRKLETQINQYQNQTLRQLQLNSQYLTLAQKDAPLDNSPSKLEEQSKINELKAIVQQIKQEIEALQMAHQQLQKTLSFKGRVAISPQMPEHPLLIAIQEKGRNIEKLIQTHNELREKMHP